ncbi:MAG: LapA family protein [Gammaproteobacteria bacterium]|nr:LapA family protein [Pseudomonadota bacterium]MCZ6716954.1 LapA family protein [Gammaproteobacteria bacterium]MCZ6881236.1 LapA family protein [Gammaproteobacteria bacterium]TDJ10752.1 MAG: LapA family protein [Gammaproteobacteria bacterium]
MLRRIVIISLVLAVAAFAAFFASLNPAVIPLDLAFGEIEAPLTLVLVVCLALGWVLGLVSASFMIFRMMAQRRTLRRSLVLAEKEIDNLRTMPAPEADGGLANPQRDAEAGFLARTGNAD